MAARAQILLAAVLFGTTGTAQALGPRLEPVAVGAARILLGAVLLGAVAAAAMAMAKATAAKATRRGATRLGGARPAAVLFAGACVAVYQVSFFAALADTGVAVGTVVAIGSAPAFAGAFARVFADEPLERRWAVATALACGGVFLLVLGGGATGQVSTPGVCLALLSGAGYAGYAVASKRMLSAGAEPEAIMAAVFGAGALMLLPVFALVPSGGLLKPGGAALALYLAAVPTALAYVLFARGLARIGAGETATLTLAEPVTAAALGVIVLGERPGLIAVAGAGLVLSGLAMLAIGRPRQTAAPRAQAPAAAHA